MFHLRTYSWLLWLLIQTFFNKLFEFTKDDTPILAVEVFSMMSEFDKKKLEAELSSRNIFRKKHKKRDDLREKWCYYGLKKRPNEQNDDFEIFLFEIINDDISNKIKIT